MKPIITSILDNDLYKVTMQNAVIHHYPDAMVKYRFINRGGTNFPIGFSSKLAAEVASMADVSMTLGQKRWLRKVCPYLPAPYIDFLWGYRFDPSEVNICQTDGDLSIGIEGPLYRAILWEVPLMALVSELYFRETLGELFYNVQEDEKIEEVAKIKRDRLSEAGCVFADFGTRRRFSKSVQRKVVRSLNGGGPCFSGTSNMLFAYENGLRPIGTHAHEWFSFHAAKYGYERANSIALGRWVDVYNGDLGIALTDTFTTDVFFNSFKTLYAKLFDGVRHDSGDPIVFAEKSISHYESLKIDPTTKTIVFSDGLNVDKAIEINNYVGGRIKTAFGIGTHFTNDVGVTPLNMVIKLWEVMYDTHSGWRPSVKLSDVDGKNTGETDEIDLARRVLRIDV